MNSTRRLADVFLNPGEIAVHAAVVYVKTIVGSCVACCLWDPQCGVGGVNHYLLPRPTAHGTADGRFGTSAIATLIIRVREAGAGPGLVAAIVGGGHPVHSLRSTAIGDDNIAVARALLQQHRVPIVRQETGGPRGRKLLFNTGTGELVVHDLRAWPPPSATGSSA